MYLEVVAGPGYARETYGSEAICYINLTGLIDDSVKFGYN